MRPIDADALISELASTWLSGEKPTLQQALKMIADFPTATNWTPCAEGLPTEDGFYMATVRIDNVLQHGEYESRVEFDDRFGWSGMSSDMKVVAWRKESPYKGDHIR